jgi:hypothetical protein
MKKALTLVLSSLFVCGLTLASLNAQASGYVSSTYGKVKTSGGSCVKGSGRVDC